jgi:hypothetical protein
MSRSWTEIEPKNAINLECTEGGEVVGPLNEMGEMCPWPWDPQQLVFAPIGQYHCRYCGAMVMAGMPHIDYKDELEAPPS